MSVSSKYRICQAVTVMGTFGIVLCLGRMIPYGIGGQGHKAALWFAASMAFLLASLPFAVGTYYYSGRSEDDENDNLSIAVKTLAASAKPSQSPAGTDDDPSPPTNRPSAQ